MPTARERNQIRAIVFGQQQLTEKAIRILTFRLHEKLVRATPVDTGWARANWVPRIGEPLDEPVGSPDDVDTAKAVSAIGLASITGFRLSKGAVNVTNNVPYIEALNAGHSKQQAAGFVQKAIREVVGVVI